MASGIDDTERTACTTRCKAASWASLYRPRQPGVMRPSGHTAVASTHSRPAPEIARLPRWIRCQSTGRPSTALYWHIGETMIRLGSVSGPKRTGVNRADVVGMGM